MGPRFTQSVNAMFLCHLFYLVFCSEQYKIQIEFHRSFSDKMLSTQEELISSRFVRSFLPKYLLNSKSGLGNALSCFPPKCDLCDMLSMSVNLIPMWNNKKNSWGGSFLLKSTLRRDSHPPIKIGGGIQSG